MQARLMFTLYVCGYIHLYIVIHMYKFTYVINTVPLEVPILVEKKFINSNFFATVDF